MFKNWNFVRMLRLAMGVFLLVETIKSGTWLLVIVGAVFTLLPLFNVGGCSNGSRLVFTNNVNEDSLKVDFEEIVEK